MPLTLHPTSFTATCILRPSALTPHIFHSHMQLTTLNLPSHPPPHPLHSYLLPTALTHSNRPLTLPPTFSTALTQPTILLTLYPTSWTATFSPSICLNQSAFPHSSPHPPWLEQLSIHCTLDNVGLDNICFIYRFRCTLQRLHLIK